MKKNMGIADRIVRLMIALFLIDVTVNSTIHGAWRIVAWVIAGILILTSLVARCPLYTFLHIHSNKIKQSHS